MYGNVTWIVHPLHLYYMMTLMCFPDGWLFMSFHFNGWFNRNIDPLIPKYRIERKVAYCYSCNF